jgi:hypothetical protein
VQRRPRPQKSGRAHSYRREIGEIKVKKLDCVVTNPGNDLVDDRSGPLLGPACDDHTRTTLR